MNNTDVIDDDDDDDDDDAENDDDLIYSIYYIYITMHMTHFNDNNF